MRIILLVLLLLIGGCGPADSNTKIVKAKHESTENRIVAQFKGATIQKLVKVYYIYAEDGSFVEVQKADFVSVRIGDIFVSSRWIKS